MRTTGWLAVLLCASVLVGGCEETKKALGYSKKAPDEFAVYSRAPLSLPPEFGLRPPAPGSERPQHVEPRDQAARAVMGDVSVRGEAIEASVGLKALLEQAGAVDTNPNIRDLINRETTILAEEDKTFTEQLMFWGTRTEYGTVVDPAREAKRIQENQALGRDVTEGGTPVIERRRKAILEGIFD